MKMDDERKGAMALAAYLILAAVFALAALILRGMMWLLN